jgi:hypothetical protein
VAIEKYRKSPIGREKMIILSSLQLAGILSEPSPETAFLGFLASISNATVRNAVLAKAQALEAVEPQVQSLAQQIYNLYAASLNATSKKTVGSRFSQSFFK